MMRFLRQHILLGCRKSDGLVFQE